MYDVAIIGLGPAGSTLARLLPDDLKVVAIDKKANKGSRSGFAAPKPDEKQTCGTLPRGSALPNPAEEQRSVAPKCKNCFSKPCGGLLAPDAQHILSRFELTLPKRILADPQIFSVRTIDVKSGIVRHYPRFYMNMDRHEFDMWLISLIPDCVDVRANTVCTSVTREGGVWHIKCGSDTVTAKYVVGADGANSLVRRAAFPNADIRTYTAIQQGFASAVLQPTGQYICVFDPDTTDCYAWGVSKGDTFVFGGAFPKNNQANRNKRNPRTNFEALKTKMLPFGYNLDNPLYTEACLVLRPATPFQFRATCDNAFLIGEAAGFISPSSLEGISYAMNSALRLSAALRTANPARAYHKSVRSIKRKLTVKMLKCPFMFSPTIRKSVMKSRITAIKKI